MEQQGRQVDRPKNPHLRPETRPGDGPRIIVGAGLGPGKGMVRPILAPAALCEGTATRPALLGILDEGNGKG